MGDVAKQMAIAFDLHVRESDAALARKDKLLSKAEDALVTVQTTANIAANLTEPFYAHITDIVFDITGELTAETEGREDARKQETCTAKLVDGVQCTGEPGFGAGRRLCLFHARLTAETEGKAEACRWVRHYHRATDIGCKPKGSNGFRFCPYCGKRIEEVTNADSGKETA